MAKRLFSGIGAGLGIEDSLVLATILEKVSTSLQSPGRSQNVHTLLANAFTLYDSVCRERSQWVVQSSRVVGDIQSWRYLGTGSDTDKICNELEWRFKKAWDLDVHALMAFTIKESDLMLGNSPKG
jgi:salicylate hydroxylase